MERQGLGAGASSDDVNLRVLFARLWTGRWIIVAVTVLFGSVAVAYALLAPQIFRSEALVQPRQEARTGAGLGALAAQFGGFADLAGMSLGGGGDRAVAVATLRSWGLVDAFIQEENLLPVLYADKWDSQSGKWKDPGSAPSLWRATSDFLKGVLRVSEDRKTGLVTVAVEWRDPVLARDWATALVKRANALLRARAIDEGEKNLAYLEVQSRHIRQVELQQALFGLVETELKKMMLAKGSDEFAFRTIDAAVVPEKRIRPKRRQIVIIGVLLGGFLGATFVLIRDAWRGAAHAG